MLIWGSGGKTVELGAATQAHCPTCEKDRTFKDVLVYRYAHIWYLFRWVTKKTYMTICEVCSRGTQHENKGYEARHGKSAIPMFDRSGGWVLLALIACFVAFVVVVGTQSDKREAGLLTQPQVGDLYSVRADKLTDGFDGTTYGVMRVAAVDAGSVTLQVPKGGYDRMKGVSRDLRTPEPQSDGYYTGETIELSRAELARHHDSGDVYDVTR